MELEELVNSAKHGDLNAFGVLVRQFERVSIHKAFAITDDFHLAQDIAQDAMVTAFEKLPQLENAAAFGSWLLEIVRRRALRQLEKNKGKQVELPINELFLDFKSPHDYQQPEWLEKHAAVLQAIKKIPEHEQDVVILRYIDQMSTGEVAKALGRPLGTVTKQLSRAIERLRTLLSETSCDYR